MSINIKTAAGLLEIGGKVTKEKVISALGYLPADEEDLPNIKEDESGNMVIADESGNIIMQVDANGLTTTNIDAKTMQLNGEDLDSRLNGIESSLTNITDNESGDLLIADNSGNAIAKFDINGLTTTTVTAKSAVINGVDIGGHVSNTDIHITATERSQWNAKSDFSGDYYDLTNAPDIREDDSGDLVIADPEGNIVFRSDGNGFETTTLTAQTVVVNGTDVEEVLNTYILNIDYSQLKFDTDEIV